MKIKIQKQKLSHRIRNEGSFKKGIKGLTKKTKKFKSTYNE